MSDKVLSLIEFAKKPFHTISLDWSEVENELGFEIHSNIKEFYSKALVKMVSGMITLDETLFESTGNEKFDNWLLKIDDEDDEDGWDDEDEDDEDDEDDWDDEDEDDEDDEDDWDDEDETDAEMTLELLTSTENISEYLKRQFSSWMGSYDFGKKLLIGNLDLSIGLVLLVIDNETGHFLWIDTEYGESEDFNEIPHGVLATTTEMLMDKILKS